MTDMTVDKSELVKQIKAQIEKQQVSQEERNSCLVTAIFETTRSHEFLGTVMQCLTITYSYALPTAGVVFNQDTKKWNLYINPYFFCKRLSKANRKAVLLHEIYHITHKHPMRIPFLKIHERKRQLMNIAADMAINQFIPDIPNGCAQCKNIDSTKEACPNEDCPGKGIHINDYFDIDVNGKKQPWPINKTMEFYYEKLLTRFSDDENKDKDQNESGNEAGDAGGGASTKDLPKTLDEHNWDGACDEKDMLEATGDLVKRAMIKAGLSQSNLPGHVKELLEEIKQRLSEINYKAIILSAMKRHAAGHNRESTWTRKSKRFGNKAPGTKVSKLPKLSNYIDTSGSISIEEANEFLSIIDEFLKVGTKKCKLSMFHTKLYYTEDYKLHQPLSKDKIENGGTDLEEAMMHIWETKPDLSVVLTDGCYSDVEVEQWMKHSDKWPQTLFIISKNGTEDHPLRRLGQTIKIP